MIRRIKKEVTDWSLIAIVGVALLSFNTYVYVTDLITEAKKMAKNRRSEG